MTDEKHILLLQEQLKESHNALSQISFIFTSLDYLGFNIQDFLNKEMESLKSIMEENKIKLKEIESIADLEGFIILQSQVNYVKERLSVLDSINKYHNENLEFVSKQEYVDFYDLASDKKLRYITSCFSDKYNIDNIKDINGRRNCIRLFSDNLPILIENNIRYLEFRRLSKGRIGVYIPTDYGYNREKDLVRNYCIDKLSVHDIVEIYCFDTLSQLFDFVKFIKK